MKIIADDKIPFLKGVLEPFAEVVYLPGSEINREIVLDADALLTKQGRSVHLHFSRNKIEIYRYSYHWF
jgi:hypothetical protein